MNRVAFAIRRLRPFHFGVVARDAPRPLGLWLSRGTDHGYLGHHSIPRPYINVTLFGRYRGRVYQKEIKGIIRSLWRRLNRPRISLFQFVVVVVTSELLRELIVGLV